MARPRTVDQAAVLDAAERVIGESGAGSLSIGSVAAAAGISKGGVQSAFGSKEGLIAALLSRALEQDDREFSRVLDALSKPDSAIAHLRTTRDADEAAHRRVAGLLAVLLQSPEHLGGVRKWYLKRLGTLRAAASADRTQRLALLAAEGAFYLRFLGLHPLDAAVWTDIFNDLEALLAGASEVR